MRLILLGSPGSGKGTQAKLLSAKLSLFHFGTGDILREAVRLNTPTGQLAKPYVVNGLLVPDDLVNQLVADRFRRDDRPERFVMDGYPRTLAQAHSFDRVLRQEFLSLDAVILLQVSDAEIIGRLAGRWSCPNPGCKATYHTRFHAPRRAGFCDDCGTALIQREDDREETVRNRLQKYHENTEELVPYFQSQGLLRAVPGEGPIDQIFQSILGVLREAGHPC